MLSGIVKVGVDDAFEELSMTIDVSEDGAFVLEARVEALSSVDVILSLLDDVV